MNKFSEIIDLEKQLQNKLQNFGKEAFKEAFTDFFTRNPYIDAVVWTQYTPYFNDGDPCIFGVHEVYLASLWFYKNIEHDYYDHIGENIVLAYDCEEMKPMYEDLDSIWKTIPESILQSVFGDHVLVRILRNGIIEVEEFEHD